MSISFLLNSAFSGGLKRLFKGPDLESVTTMVDTFPLLSVQPTRGLVDEKFQILIRNLAPKEHVTLHSLHHSEDKDFWEAFGHYVSDDTGTVDVTEHACVGGTYEGTEPMGLLWSLRPVPGSRSGLRLRKRDVLSPIVVKISLHGGHKTQGFSQSSALATVVTERWYLAPGVRRVDVKENEISGTLFLPPGPGPFPGVLDMWGGGGGLVEYRSALLASHGFASFALEYISTEKMSSSLVELGFFEKAYGILHDHPMVRRDQLALFGLSFGTSVSLTLAAYSKAVKPKCCVCISGSHVQPVRKSLVEVFEEINKQMDKARVDENNCVIWRDVILPIPTDMDKKIDMGRVKCPLMLVVGEDDQNWATAESAEDIACMMEKAGNGHLLTVLSYPEAGHLIEPPYTPHFRSSNFIIQQTKEKVVMLWGGQTKPHAFAQEDSWKKILEFLQEHLCSKPNAVPVARL